MVPLGLVTVKVTSTSAPSIESQDPIRGGSFGRGELSVGSGSPLSQDRCGRRSGGGVGSHPRGHLFLFASIETGRLVARTAA